MYIALLLKGVAASAYIAFFVLSEADLALERTRFHGGLVKKIIARQVDLKYGLNSKKMWPTKTC